MKAYELMIFNYVYGNGDILLLDKWEFKAHVIDGECKNIVPIPLDESWLVKFGFKILDIAHSKESTFYRLDSQDVNVHPVGGFTYGVRGTPLCKVHTVHHLQNLFHSLTNQELEKEKKKGQPMRVTKDRR